MKSKILNIVLSLVILGLVIKLAMYKRSLLVEEDSVKAVVSSVFDDREYDNEVLRVIHSRKSVRHFTGQNISKKQLVTLVKAGMAAPSAVNRQSWAFYIVTNRQQLDEMAKVLPYAKMLSQAPAAIVVCGDLIKAGDLKDDEYWVLDCSAATENILLAAESMGLGAVWTATYPGRERADSVIRILDFPEHHTPLNVIPIGYPAGNDKPKDKWMAENLIWKD
jgi:nitroreductase